MLSLIALLILSYILVNHFSPIRVPNSSIDTQSKVVTADNERKIVYLTFDDGPSTVVTNEILKRIYNEGHTIGLHTYTHKYRQIYSSESAFIEEMDKTAEEIKRVINIEPKAIRFPSGSKKHLSISLLEKLH